MAVTDLPNASRCVVLFLVASMELMQRHFLLPLEHMAAGEWLKLGGTSGDGILEIRIEAA